MNRATHDGQAIYGPLVLAGYDLAVLTLTCRLVWKVSKTDLLEMYRRNIGAAHLDVGVGTGYLLKRTARPGVNRITLFDMNQSALDTCSRRLREHRPESVRGDALQRFPFADGAFDSAGANFLLHCLPGSIAEKGVVLRELRRVVRPGGRVFGATVLRHGVPVGPTARRLMEQYNAKGYFHNADDSLSELERELAEQFVAPTVVVRGCVALFEAERAR